MSSTNKKIAVVGGGIMGADVALDLAINNIPVILKDVSEKKLEEARNKVRAGLRMVKMMKKELATKKIDEVLSLITFTADYNSFLDVDLVIENVSELYDVKKAVFEELEKVCAAEVIYAVNTSCISITKLASPLRKPERMIGVHFMNPVPLKKMVEAVRGFHTSEEVEATVVSFLKSINKEPVVVNDQAGFVANRVSHLYMNEAAFVVQDMVATAAQVDTIFRQGYGHSMGPLETADLIGLDTVLYSLHVLYDSYKDTKFRPCPLLEKMVNAGLLGRKSGKGFYNYN